MHGQTSSAGSQNATYYELGRYRLVVYVSQIYSIVRTLLKFSSLDSAQAAVLTWFRFPYSLGTERSVGHGYSLGPLMNSPTPSHTLAQRL